MASIDLKHAYCTIPIAQEQQKFLKFVWNDQLYEFTALPMGLSSSPRIFTKVMKPVLAKLRQKGHINSGFIDDFYLQGQEISHCTVNLSDTVRLFIALGLHVHPDKCILIPSQEILMLGFLINSLLMTVKLPLEKKERLRDLCMQILHGTRFTIQCIASLIGSLVSALPGVEFGRLHYRNIERDKINALALHKGNYQAFMTLSEAAKQELSSWTANVIQAFRHLRHPVVSYIFQTDASELGWGIHCTTHSTLQSQGLWSKEQHTLHINVRELYVVFICLTIFCKDVSAVHIRFELVNQTAVSYLNHMGGCKSVACDTVARKIWAWCNPRNIWLTAVFIPGPSNVTADSLSRKHLSAHEWQLNRTIFQTIANQFPPFSIDLFASMLNTQLDRYASWHPDPQASIIDAFSV